MKTPIFPTLLRFLCVGALLLATSACSAPAQDANAPATPAPSQASLLEQIKTEVGNAACDSTEQCQTIAIGAKACGGPERYLAWSSKSNDGKKIKALAYAQAEASRRQQQNDGMLSTCSIITDPGASCVAGRCELQKPNLNGGSAL
ncbi:MULTISPECIES: hypothetical protein [unclassified Janthinobacterium]|uniref:hypothetical protein n=1 Tax=unclassified Janthinobacterium TaxID=2610881 RepID=UPI00161B5CAD|nr:MULTISPECIES: hypothetical protein [unclassified Janthinobacterium]MBB5606034.1 hypothetical protein [Janthinobacterium sp. S3T4]MBB5611048.1 hypothetical protein [Janthinobacterium sp. S3M3]